MENMNYIIFICIMVPMFFLLFIIKEKFARTIIGFVTIGVFACLFISEVNGLLLEYFGGDYRYVTTSITPVTEEIIKALPVLFFAYLFSDDLEKLEAISFSVGIGFAILENMVVLLQNVETVSLFWALIRGFGSALMHGICTGAVGLGMHFIHQKPKLFLSGTFALLVLAIIYHSIYNTLVQSQFKYFGFILPLTTFIIISAFAAWKKHTAKKAASTGSKEKMQT